MADRIITKSAVGLSPMPHPTIRRRLRRTRIGLWRRARAFLRRAVGI